MSHVPSRTGRRVLFLVRTRWVVGNITRLGPGSRYHLAFHPTEIAPDLREDLVGGEWRNVTGEILHRQGDEAFSIADVAVVDVNDFLQYYRFDLEIRSLSIPVHVSDTPFDDPHILCAYGPNDGHEPGRTVPTGSR